MCWDLCECWENSPTENIEDFEGRMKKEVTDAENIDDAVIHGIEKACVNIRGYGENIAEALEYWVYKKTVKNEFRMLPYTALRNKG